MSVKENLSAINEMGTKGYERLNSLTELNLRTWEKMAARQMEAMKLLMEQGSRHMKLASESKGYSELLKAEVELAKDVSNRLVEEAKTNMQIAGEVRDLYRDWFQEGVNDLSAKVGEMAPKA